MFELKGYLSYPNTKISLHDKYSFFNNKQENYQYDAYKVNSIF